MCRSAVGDARRAPFYVWGHVGAYMKSLFVLPILFKIINSWLTFRIWGHRVYLKKERERRGEIYKKYRNRYRKKGYYTRPPRRYAEIQSLK